MSSPLLTVEMYNLPALQRALNLYREMTGKTWGDILAKEGREWAMELYAAFKKISPAKGTILADAQARGYRVARNAEGLVGHKVRDGLSAAAVKGAENYLEGRKSDYFYVRENEGVLQVRRARFSGKGKHKRLKGGRWGNKFARSAIHAGDLSNERLLEAKADPTLKRLNIRALAVAIDLSLRARAAKGGTMAVQWLYKVYKRSKNALLKTGPLVQRNKQGIELGRVEITKGPDGEPVLITISGEVPGTAKQSDRHGIVSQVASLRVADRMAYINRKLGELKQKAGLS